MLYIMRHGKTEWNELHKLQGQDVLIVGHGALNSAIICLLKKLPISEFWSNGIPQCKLIEVPL